MKKKFLIAIIPALLVLSSCANINNATVVKGNEFLEDTLAHDEIFSNEKLEVPSLQPKRTNDDPVDHPKADEFAIGVQSQVETEGHISFRFVAAVRFAESELDPTQAAWRRTVSYANGDARKATSDIACAKAYKKISNGGGSYSIDDYNSAHELTGENQFTHFVVYTLRNVPVDANNYYVSAYLKLSPKAEGGKTLDSKAVAINADKSQKYVYTANLGTSFAVLTHNATDTIINTTNVRASSNDDKFQKSGLTLASGDTFVIKEFHDTHLYVKGSEVITGDNNPAGYYFSDNSGVIKVNYAGTFNLFLNKDNQLWINASHVVRPIYLNLASWWFSGDCHVALCAFKYSNNSQRIWFTWDKHSDFLLTNGSIDPTLYDTIKVVRVLDGNDPSFDSPQYGNYSNTVPFPDVPEYDEEKSKMKDCVYVYGDSDPRGISIGSRD